MTTSGPRVVAVVGPTASGKSELGVALAEALGGEIVNADALQLYRGMDIGTAKLPADQRRGVPHHQLDVLTVTDEASVAAYQQSARTDLAGIATRGRVPILVGGSGLYVRAALDHLEIPPTDAALRQGLAERAERVGTPAMYAELHRLDPVAAAGIEPGNTRRIVRALEVIELTGRPFSATLPRREYVVPTVQVALAPPREVLDARIEARVHRMWRAGLVSEVSGLVEAGLRGGRTAATAIGYAQALAQLDGALNAEQAQQDTVRATRRFARRQLSWFRPDKRITWFDPTDPDCGHAVAAHVRGELAAMPQPDHGRR